MKLLLNTTLLSYSTFKRYYSIITVSAYAILNMLHSFYVRTIKLTLYQRNNQCPIGYNMFLAILCFQ